MILTLASSSLSCSFFFFWGGGEGRTNLAYLFTLIFLISSSVCFSHILPLNGVKTHILVLTLPCSHSHSSSLTHILIRSLNRAHWWGWGVVGVESAYWDLTSLFLSHSFLSLSLARSLSLSIPPSSLCLCLSICLSVCLSLSISLNHLRCVNYNPNSIDLLGRLRAEIEVLAQPRTTIVIGPIEFLAHRIFVGPMATAVANRLMMPSCRSLADEDVSVYFSIPFF